MVMPVFAAGLRGAECVFEYSGRFAGNSCGPILATSVLAFSGLTTTYLVVAALTLLSFLGFKCLSNVEKED